MFAISGIRRRAMPVIALVVGLAALATVPGYALADAPPGSILGTDFLTPGQTEPVPSGMTSPVPKWPREYDSTTGFWGATFAQVGDHEHAVVSPTVAVGAGRVYVASSYQRAVFMYDADTLAPIAINGGVFGTGGAGQLDNPQGVAVYRNEVYVSDPGDTDWAHGPGRIMVYDTDGNFKRSFAGKIQGIDVAWGEIWGRAAESAVDPLLLGQRWPLRMEARDTQTGLLRAVVPFNEGCGQSEGTIICIPYLHYGRDHDVAVAPDVGAVFNGYSIMERNPLYPALTIGYGSMQNNAYSYCTYNQWPTARGEPMGATTVWGAKTLMTADNCTGTDSAGGWKYGTIHQIGLQENATTGLVNQSYMDQWWWPQDRSDVARDVAFRPTKARIVWMAGNLPDQASWMAGTQCVRYVIADGDWYIVGNRGERWYKVASGMTGSIGLTLNGTQVAYAAGSTDPTQPKGTLCFDTAHPFGPGSNVASGTYSLTMTATVNGSQITRTNPTLHLDHDPPTGGLNGLPPATNAPVSTSGTISDSHSGAGTWNLQVNGPGTAGNWQTACAASGPNAGSSTWGCTWNTNAYPEGTYQVRALLADRVQPSYGGPNTVGANTQAVIVDRTPPSLRDPAPALGSDFASQVDHDVVRVWMIQTDGGSGVRETTLEYNSAPDGSANGSWDPANAAPATNTNPEYPDEGYTTWNTSAIPDGLHRIRATTCDRASNCAQNQWQVVMSARRRTCPGTAAGPRCYAGQAFGDYEDGIGPLGGFGLRGIIQAPKKAPPYGSGFSGDHVAVIGSAANTDEIGISNNSCQYDSGMAWYAYAYIIDGTFGNPDPCFARIPAGQARKFQVVIAAGRAYVAMSFTPTGPYRTRAVSGIRRSTWVGRGRADLPGEAETDRYGRYIGGWFIGMRYRSRNGTWRGPVRLSRQDEGHGYRSEYASDISNYCVHGPGASCTPKTSP